MNRVFLLFFLIVSIQFTHAQVTDKTKQKSEMQQAVDDMKKEISDLEAEIKSAENTDPDEVAAMKNQLAMLKNMLSKIDNTSKSTTQSQKAQTANISAPKLIQSPIVPVSFKQPVVIPTAAQAKDRLLWYSGKKYNDSTLVTEKGMVVQFSKKKNIVVLQPQKKTDPFDKVVQEYEKGEQRKEELIDKFDKMKNGFMFYPELKNGLALFDDITIRFSNVLKNTVELPVVPLPTSTAYNSTPVKSGFGPYVGFISYDTIPDKNKNEEILKEMKEYWDEEIALAKKELKELPPVSEFPAPPIHEFGICYLCDTSLLSKKRIQDSIWFDQYWGKEQRIVQRVLGVERQMQLLGGNGWDYHIVLDTIIKRGMEKNKILYEKYGNDIRYIDNVLIVLLGSERQVQLLGGSDDSFSAIQLVVKSLNLYDKYLDEQIEAKNHDFVLNIASHLDNERKKQLLGAGEAGSTNVLLDKFLKYNRFALTIDLDFIIEKRGDKDKLEFKATGAMSTKDKVYGMFVSDSCSYRMIQYNIDLNNAKLDDVTIPFIVKSGIKSVRNEDDKLEDFSYSGPSGYLMNFPDLKIGFCNNNKPDSAFFTTFLGDESAANMSPGTLNNLIKSYKIDFLGYANLVLQNTNSDEKENEITDLGNEITNAIGGYQNMNLAGSKLEKLKMQYEGKRQMDSYRKSIQKLTNDRKSIFLFSANNKSTVLVDKFEDTKRKLDDDFNLIRGLIHLRVLHDPVK
jgi:hypothetical protein